MCIPKKMPLRERSPFLSLKGSEARWAQNRAQSLNHEMLSRRKLLVRKGGLEPPRFYPPDPKSGASANSATFALLVFPGTARILNASALAFHDPVPRSGAYARTLDCMAQLSTSPEDWNERAALFNYRCRGC